MFKGKATFPSSPSPLSLPTSSFFSFVFIVSLVGKFGCPHPQTFYSSVDVTIPFKNFMPSWILPGLAAGYLEKGTLEGVR